MPAPRQFAQNAHVLEKWRYTTVDKVVAGPTREMKRIGLDNKQRKMQRTYNIALANTALWSRQRAEQAEETAWATSQLPPKRHANDKTLDAVKDPSPGKEQSQSDTIDRIRLRNGCAEQRKMLRAYDVALANTDLWSRQQRGMGRNNGVGDQPAPPEEARQ